MRTDAQGILHGQEMDAFLPINALEIQLQRLTYYR